jgi:hypothetical protein
VQPTGGQNNQYSPGQQPPPASDPWNQQPPPSGDEPVSAESYPQYSVPSADPATSLQHYAQPAADYGAPVNQAYDVPVYNQPPPPVQPPVPPPPPDYGFPQPGYVSPPPGYPQQQSAPPYPQQQSAPPYPQQQSAPPYLSQPVTAPPVQPLYQPPQYGAPPPVLPPPAKKSNTGLIVGLVGGGLVLLLVICGGVAFAAGLFSDNNKDRKTSQSTTATPGDGTPSAATSAEDSPTPSPAVTARDLATLDDKSTDQTPFELDQFFPAATFNGGGGEVYTRAGYGFYSACENSGGDKLKTLLTKNGCGNMAVGVYLNHDKTIMTGVMVIPLPNASNATAVYNGIKADSTIPPTFWIWCPPAGQPGGNICTSADRNNAYRQWFYGNYHRYLIVAIALHTDGRASNDEVNLTKTDQDCRAHVIDALPVIR